MTIGHSAQDVVVSEETAYQDLRRDRRPCARRSSRRSTPRTSSTPRSSIAAGTVVAHSDPSRVGERLPDGDDLASLTAASGVTQLRAVYQTDRMLEWRQPMLLGDTPFAEMRVGLSTLLIRQSLTKALRPAAYAAVIALAGRDRRRGLAGAGRRAADSRDSQRAHSPRPRRSRRDARPQGRRVQGARRRVRERDEPAQGGDAGQRQARRSCSSCRAASRRSGG